MCTPSSQLILCPCINESSARPAKGIYQWKLDRYLGSRESPIMGSIVAPSSDLGSGITVANMIRELNSRNCFDFEYSPKEKDSLHISTERTDGNYQYFTLLYTNGLWAEGSHPGFGKTVLENLGKGKIKGQS